ncbi:hypothetical protein MPSEU_001087600 [Mayamaea pseudoterrestris]|nr:hypothetical protein MPSEU_001087600 [Mayamaea pseudoterrestris]
MNMDSQIARRRVAICTPSVATLLLFSMQACLTNGWTTPHTHQAKRPNSHLYQSSPKEPFQRQQEDTAAGQSMSSDNVINGNASFSSIITSADSSKSQLFSAFSALDLNDQYDAVLTGLCANKILDNVSVSASEALEIMSDPLQLLQEMNQKKIRASPRSLMAMIDSAVKTQDASCMQKVLTLARRNSAGLDQYASLQTEIQLLPSSLTQRVKCADGSFKTRSERLEQAASIPDDDREQEILSAFIFAGLCGACILTDVLSMESVAPFANVALGSALAVGAIDNFYDLFQGILKFAQKDNDNKMNLPDKADLPLGLGSGKLTGKVVGGLQRLLTVDAERESQCEAAALYAAYHLGLACFAFRPNALEGSALVIESTRGNNEIDSLDNSAGYLKLLIWLLAPVCAESMKHSQLIMSNPKEATSFLDRLEKYETDNPGSLPGVWWQGEEKERDDLLAWAYAEAEYMLRQNRGAVEEVARCLTGGAATVGDCVAVMERW